MTTVGDDGGWAMEVGRAHPEEGCDGVCSRAASVLVGGVRGRD